MGVRIRITVLTTILCVMVGYLIYNHEQTISHRFATRPFINDKFIVMAVGGSDAAGWGDKQNEGGYLKRAFKLLSAETNDQYNFVNKSVAGCGPVQFQSGFRWLLPQIKPQMVIFSYGILDDVNKNTPINVFSNDVRSQICQSLNDYDSVILTTPPISVASYTIDKTQIDKYVNAELQVAASFNSPHIYVFDLKTKMEEYIKNHNQNYRIYVRDNWHLNDKGHALAGQLLASWMNSALES